MILLLTVIYTKCGIVTPPLKVLAFSWKLLVGRLHTRGALARRGVVFNGGARSMCPLQ